MEPHLHSHDKGKTKKVRTALATRRSLEITDCDDLLLNVCVRRPEERARRPDSLGSEHPEEGCQNVAGASKTSGGRAHYNNWCHPDRAC